MPLWRQVKRYRSGAGHSDIGLWHLGAGLLAVGGVLGAVIGLPPSPWPVVTTLMWSARSGVAPASATTLSPPSITDVEVFFRSPSTPQLDAVAGMLSWIAWLLWL